MRRRGRPSQAIHEPSCGYPFAVHARAEPDFAQERDGAGLEHAGANPLEYVRSRLPLQHDRVDAVAVENVGEQQARRPGADDDDFGAQDLGSHGSPWHPQNGSVELRNQMGRFLGQWIGGAGHLSTIDGAPARR